MFSGFWPFFILCCEQIQKNSLGRPRAAKRPHRGPQALVSEKFFALCRDFGSELIGFLKQQVKLILSGRAVCRSERSSTHWLPSTSICSKSDAALGLGFGTLAPVPFFSLGPWSPILKKKSAAKLCGEFADALPGSVIYVEHRVPWKALFLYTHGVNSLYFHVSSRECSSFHWTPDRGSANISMGVY